MLQVLFFVCLVMPNYNGVRYHLSGLLLCSGGDELQFGIGNCQCVVAQPLEALSAARSERSEKCGDLWEIAAGDGAE